MEARNPAPRPPATSSLPMPPPHGYPDAPEWAPQPAPSHRHRLDCTRWPTPPYLRSRASQWTQRGRAHPAQSALVRPVPTAAPAGPTRTQQRGRRTEAARSTSATNSCLFGCSGARTISNVPRDGVVPATFAIVVPEQQRDQELPQKGPDGRRLAYQQGPSWAGPRPIPPGGPQVRGASAEPHAPEAVHPLPEPLVGVPLPTLESLQAPTRQRHQMSARPR